MFIKWSISGTNESQVTSNDTKLEEYDDPLRGEKSDSLKDASVWFWTWHIFIKVFLPIPWITFETETICSNFKLYHQRNTEFYCCVGHEQAVGARCTIVYIYMEWKSSLNLLPLEIKEKCNEKISIVLSIREGFESKSKKMPRMLLIYTTCTFAVVYILWITTIT